MKSTGGLGNIHSDHIGGTRKDNAFRFSVRLSAWERGEGLSPGKISTVAQQILNTVVQSLNSFNRFYNKLAKFP